MDNNGSHSAVAGFRSDIEGWRAIAILLVVAFHARVPGVPGGFIGVDVFFVLSGYLITGLLLREARTNDRIDLLRFYARRVRRLLPAATVLLLSVVVVSLFVLAPLEQVTVAKTALFTALYSGNIWFARNAVDYLGSSADTNPLLHMWSLAVEEQFYIVWPLLVALSCRSRLRWMVLAVIASVTVVSFGFNLWITKAVQPWAFFGMPARAWEFGIGGLVALVPLWWIKRHQRALLPLLIAGAAGVLISGVVFTRATPFPGYAAVLPVVGTAFVLGVGAMYPLPWGVFRVLNTPVMQWIGRLSYSWYLWHWPVAVLTEVYFGPLPLVIRLAWMGVALGLAWVTYTYVETPVRTYQRLAPKATFTVAAAAVVTFLSSTVAVGWGRRATAFAATPVQHQLSSARDDLPVIYANHCHATFAGIQQDACEFGDRKGAATVVLFGDSHAAQWFPALDRVAQQRHWKLISWTKSGCPSANIPVQATALQREYYECDEWRTATIAKIIALRPTFVFLANSNGYVLDTLDNGLHQTTPGRFADGLAETAYAFGSRGIHSVVINDTPRPNFDVPLCLSRAVWRHDVGSNICAINRSKAVDMTVSESVMRSVGRVVNARIIDFTDVLCTSTQCDAERDGIVVYRDANHLTAAVSAQLAPALAARL